MDWAWGRGHCHQICSLPSPSPSFPEKIPLPSKKWLAMCLESLWFMMVSFVILARMEPALDLTLICSLVAVYIHSLSRTNQVPKRSCTRIEREYQMIPACIAVTTSMRLITRRHCWHDAFQSSQQTSLDNGSRGRLIWTDRHSWVGLLGRICYM